MTIRRSTLLCLIGYNSIKYYFCSRERSEKKAQMLFNQELITEQNRQQQLLLEQQLRQVRIDLLPFYLAVRGMAVDELNVTTGASLARFYCNSVNVCHYLVSV